MASVLITWSCGHFCIRHSTGCESANALIEAATDDFWFLSSTSKDDLANIATSRHISSSGNCPKCQECVAPGMWKLRAHQSIDQLLYLYDSCKTMYLEAGARCACAHGQFWLSTTPRHLDPLFAPMEKIVNYCHEADVMLRKSRNREDIVRAFERINKARAKVGRLMGPLDEILTGIELMSAAKSKHRENEVSEYGIISRESMVAVPKAWGYLARMEDWEDEAIGAIRAAMK